MDLIPDIDFIRLITKFRWYGYTARKIEAETGISANTIYNYTRESKFDPSFKNGRKLINLAKSINMEDKDLQDCITDNATP